MKGTVSSSCVPYVGEKESCLAGQCRGESLPVSYLASTWAILNSTTEMMQVDLMILFVGTCQFNFLLSFQAISQYGSITTFFTVFSDFGSYVSGVYKCDPDASNYLGHAVQLIGTLFYSLTLFALIFLFMLQGFCFFPLSNTILIVSFVCQAGAQTLTRTSTTGSVF